MKIFLDTSALFKLYHEEAGSDEMEEIFIKNEITNVFLSELSQIEFASTVWKRFRTKDIDENQTRELINIFESDLHKYVFVQIDKFIIEQSKKLISKFGKEGLRTSDSIQLATSLSLKDQIHLFKTYDKLLDKFLKSEGLSTS